MQDFDFDGMLFRCHGVAKAWTREHIDLEKNLHVQTDISFEENDSLYSSRPHNCVSIISEHSAKSLFFDNPIAFLNLMQFLNVMPMDDS